STSQGGRISPDSRLPDRKSDQVFWRVPSIAFWPTAAYPHPCRTRPEFLARVRFPICPLRSQYPPCHHIHPPPAHFVPFCSSGFPTQQEWYNAQKSPLSPG